MNCTLCDSVNTREILALNSGQYIFLCKNCRNAFTWPKPVVPDYAAEDFHARGLVTEKLIHFGELPGEIQYSYEMQASLIEKYIQKGDPILEIGGGEGIFLDWLQQRGHTVEMNEPSLSAGVRAATRGLKVYNLYFQENQFDTTYSLITMAHVLEHMQNPLRVMEDLKLILKPRGYVLLTQTNFKGFMPRFLKQDWYAWVPDQHFTHFSVTGINYLAEKSGYEVVEYRYSRLFHGNSIYHRVLQYVPFLQDQIHVLLKLKA